MVAAGADTVRDETGDSGGAAVAVEWVGADADAGRVGATKARGTGGTVLGRVVLDGARVARRASPARAALAVAARVGVASHRVGVSRAVGGRGTGEEAARVRVVAGNASTAVLCSVVRMRARVAARASPLVATGA